MRNTSFPLRFAAEAAASGVGLHSSAVLSLRSTTVRTGAGQVPVVQFPSLAVASNHALAGCTTSAEIWRTSPGDWSENPSDGSIVRAGDVSVEAGDAAISRDGD